jgi:redox-sensitive bicupin YhaK (pirin superfamily)
VRFLVSATSTFEGAGFPVRRAFPGSAGHELTDPFLLLDHIGPVVYGPGEAKGAPWHPHRGFETVTYVIDGAVEHHDSTGGGGLITDGATQWMTAGAGILHDEMPPDSLLRAGGLMHATQLWVNLPAALKMTPPRYQDLHADRVGLLASDDGGALLRIIAGTLGDFAGPGVTQTPIIYLHASMSSGARLQVPWPPDYNAVAYVLEGSGAIGPDERPIRDGQLAIFGPGEALTLHASARSADQAARMEVLLLGGRPIREPVVFYGPFVMNTEDEIRQALLDYRQGRLGTMPAIRP